jgi:hypothetical protein
MLLTRERRDLYLPLDECEIPTDARAKLEALGITTVEELKAYWFYDNRELLTQYLGDSPLNLVATKPPAGAVRGMAARRPGGSVNLLATGPVPPLRLMPRGVELPIKYPEADCGGRGRLGDGGQPGPGLRGRRRVRGGPRRTRIETASERDSRSSVGPAIP